ncbi:MAG TPA: biopolymer transporter ExbD [Candidatus Latescibacteria bacterium]|nr:MAG: Biopolymer transport protein ExbD [Candidatus Latescibacteria bacterium ADurb.Bin168]HNZ37910.1 biopolymer transporter ExbD [Candidatus Latescibacterota bacterium]HOF61844.1 biopolymer transporter ExbD [Candidatus Latescibacterota bacterium]HOM56296.1 biopolymer transporter ExbD [Candidatus Latescibacterota bacterium]HOS65322.1 biopolymer transporter ExbD [Candidatus Latescibacterota bacterium]
MKLRKPQGAITTFAAQSLTDIVFLLLIFFLLTSTFVLQTGVKVQLPQTTADEPVSEKMVVISLTKDGSVYLNENLVSRPELVGRLRQLLVSKEQIVILRADKSLSLDLVVGVMDIAKSSGASRFLIATQTEE